MAVLVLLILGAFWSAIQNGFVGFDDPIYVTANPHVQAGLNWDSIEWAFRTFEAGNWHPLTWLSHMLDAQLFGMGPRGHHLSSILLHLVNTLLLFAVLRQLIGVFWTSFLVAVFFGVHPLRVESVAWVSERKDVLSTLFFMLTLWSYARYCQLTLETGKSEAGAPRLRSRAPLLYVLALLSFALGLMSKPMLVTLPFLLLLLDYWPLNRFQVSGFRRLFLEKIPFLVLTIAASTVTFLAQKSSGAIIASVPLAQRLSNALVSYCRYLEKIFWPAKLAVFYPPVAAWPLHTVFLAGLLIASVTVLAVLTRRAYPWLFVGWFWFLGTLVPVIGFVQAGEQSMADRYSYIPSIGVLLIVFCALARLVLYPRPHRAVLPLAAALGLAAATVLVGLTARQIGYWKTTERLFRHALAVTENNYLAHNNLGTALDQQGRLTDARDEFELSLNAKPSYAEAHHNLGVVLAEQGHFDEAISHYLAALRLRPRYPEAHNSLGILLQKQGRLDDAITEFAAAVALKPAYADAHENLGVALGNAGRVPESIVEFQNVIRLQPASTDAHNNLGAALERQGRLDEAVREYKEAVRLKPDYARAHFNLGVGLTRQGQIDSAISEFQLALRLKPDYAAARTNLNLLLQFKNREQDIPGTAAKPK
jgi:protein O-mannosyl-transferase